MDIPWLNLFSTHTSQLCDHPHLSVFFSSCFQLDQLVIDSAMEKRDMEHKHATIQQRVSKQLFHLSPFPMEVGEVWVWD